MDNKQKAQLQQMIEEYGVQDSTNEIREKKQSVVMMQELQAYKHFKRTSRLSKHMFVEKARQVLKYWHSNYKSIFDKIVMNEIDLDILNTFVMTLKDVEDGKINQHEASFRIGTLLKKIYVDEKINEPQKANSKKATTSSSSSSSTLTWKQYKEGLDIHDMD